MNQQILETITNQLPRIDSELLFTMASACGYEIRLIFKANDIFVVESIVEGSLDKGYTRYFDTPAEAMADAAASLVACFEEA